MKCNQKVPYITRELAEDALRRYVKAKPRDPRNARLVTYQCHRCGIWHLGHARKTVAAINKPAAPEVKQPKPGQLRRRAAKEAEKAARQAFYADHHQTLQFCKMLVDREIARMEALGVPKHALGERR